MFISSMYETWWCAGCVSTPCLFLWTFSAFILTKDYDEDLKPCGFRMLDAPNPTRAPWWLAPNAGWPPEHSEVAQVLLLCPAGPCTSPVSGTVKPLLEPNWCLQVPPGEDVVLEGSWRAWNLQGPRWSLEQQLIAHPHGAHIRMLSYFWGWLNPRISIVWIYPEFICM